MYAGFYRYFLMKEAGFPAFPENPSIFRLSGWSEQTGIRNRVAVNMQPIDKLIGRAVTSASHLIGNPVTAEILMLNLRQRFEEVVDLKGVVQNVLLGVAVFVGGLIVILLLTSSDMEAELTYYAAIAYALLYLASVISVCTAVVIRKINQLHLTGYDAAAMKKAGNDKM